MVSLSGRYSHMQIQGKRVVLRAAFLPDGRLTRALAWDETIEQTEDLATTGIYRDRLWSPCCPISKLDSCCTGQTCGRSLQNSCLRWNGASLVLCTLEHYSVFHVCILSPCQFGDHGKGLCKVARTSTGTAVQAVETLPGSPANAVEESPGSPVSECDSARKRTARAMTPPNSEQQALSQWFGFLISPCFWSVPGNGSQIPLLQRPHHSFVFTRTLGGSHLACAKCSSVWNVSYVGIAAVCNVVLTCVHSMFQTVPVRCWCLVVCCIFFKPEGFAAGSARRTEGWGILCNPLAQASIFDLQDCGQGAWCGGCAEPGPHLRWAGICRGRGCKVYRVGV